MSALASRAGAAAESRTSLRPIAGLAILLLTGLLLRDAWPPDETRYADVARGIAAGEGWRVPHLHDRVYREKPAAAFWLAAGLTQLGVPAGAAPRAVSGLAALATLALLPAIAGALGLARSTSARASWVLATSPLFLAYAQAGMLDASATAWVTAAIAAKLARAGRPPSARAALVLCEAIALAAALLTKGPVLLLFPIGLRLGAAFARDPSPTLARERSAARADASDAAVLGLALCAVGAVLLAAADAAGARYVRALVIGQLLRRVGADAPHLRAPGWLLGFTLLGLLPWTLLGIPVVRLWRAGRMRPRAQLAAAPAALLGWIVLPALALSVLRTQQPHYLLPSLPAFALLLGEAAANPERWALRAAGALAVIASGALWIAALGAPLFTDNPAERALVADVGLRVSAVIAAAFLLALVFAPAARRRPAWARAAAGVAALALTAFVFLARFDPWMSPRALLAQGAVRSARALAAPLNACSSVRLAGGPRDVVAKGRKSVGAWLVAAEGRVALVWARDLGRLSLAPAAFEEIGRGHLGARTIVALRAAPAAHAPADPVP